MAFTLRVPCHRLFLVLASAQLVVLANAASADSHDGQFEGELSEAAVQISRIVSNPPANSWIQGPRLREFRDALHVARIWPHALLRSALLDLLKHNDPGFVGTAAWGLLAFNDAEGLLSVQPLLNDERTIVAGCFGFPLSDRVREGIEEHQKVDSFIVSYGESELPLIWDEWEPLLFVDGCANAGMTVVDAIRIMRDARGPPRIQSFYWLAREGFVFEVEPLIEAWRRASIETRSSLLLDLRLAGKYVGQDRLRTAVEHLVVELDPRELSAAESAVVAAGLAAVESRMALEFAFRVVDEFWQIDTESMDSREDVTPEERALSRALDAVQEVATDEDLGTALVWSLSPNLYVQRGALSILSRIDHPTAVECVLGFLRTDEKLNMWYAPDVLGAISGRTRCDNGVCWTYVKAVNERLQRVATDIGNEKRWHPLTSDLDALIHALEELTGVHNGFESFASPGFNSQKGVATARRWADWVSRNSSQHLNAAPLPREETAGGQRLFGSSLGGTEDD